MNKNNFVILGLLISIAINLFFVGGIAYRFSNFKTGFMGRPLPPNVGWIVRDLSEERRTQLSPLLQQSFDATRSIRGEMFTTQRRVNELMSAQPFDGAALNQAFTELRDANLRYQSLSHEQTSLILNELSEEERQTALEFIERRGPRDGRDGFRGMEHGPNFGGRRFSGSGGPGRPPSFPAPEPDQ
ncbi:MAG: hypothetical protein COA96_14400 [SAR86 cluster bacterium]|uniref:Signaling pathway modulator ZraP n=1 Tax=SAR86 cluster bacterium TaxID=2030880 RepID=A0A2A5AUK9_9GAMM|nr:MAG: hypothetical protein COA96_14400 [SAR86 cluster bacterium]